MWAIIKSANSESTLVNSLLRGLSSLGVGPVPEQTRHHLPTGLQGQGGQARYNVAGTSLLISSSVCFFNPFLFIKTKRLYPQRVSPPLKNMQWYVLRGQCCPSSQVWQPSADSNGRLAHFFKIWTCWVGRDSLLQIVMAVWRTSNKIKKCAKRILPSAEGCHTLQDPSAELFAEGPTGSKDTLSLISRSILELGFFFKKPMSPEDTVQEEFWVNDVCTLLGQESPLMNKKGLTTSLIIAP